MSDNKKYYYLKLKENFFDSEEIKVLESMDNGYKYSNILLKLYLKSLKKEGLLMFKQNIPYNAKMIATVTGHNVNDVKGALDIFKQLGLVEILSNGAIYMMDIQNFIGTSSTEADRVRAYRNEVEKKKQELLDDAKNVDPEILIDGKTGDVTNVQQMNDKRTPEKELSESKSESKEKDNNMSSQKDDDIEEVWQQYKSIFADYYTPRKFSQKRKGKIKQRLDTYSVDELVNAMKAIADSDYMIGKNDNGKFYAKPEYCFRNDEKVEEWLNDYEQSENVSFGDEKIDYYADLREE